jgi:hypothetical protein
MSLPLHVFNEPIYTAQSLTTNSSSSSQNLDEVRGYCIAAVITGSHVGTLQVTGSNDNVNFGNVPGSQFTVAISSAGTYLISDPSPDYSYVQLQYIFTSGTGSISASINAKR